MCGSIYSNIAEQFKIYLDTLAADEINEIENDFRANGDGDGLPSVRDRDSAEVLFNSFAMFYYINGRLPDATGHLFVPDGEIPPGIVGEKLNLEELFAKVFRTKSNGLVSEPFVCALLLLLAVKEDSVKNFLTELYGNLTVEVLSTDNDSVLKFEALADLCAEINVRLANFVFANQERARLDMKKQAVDDNFDKKKPKEEIDEKKHYFPDDVIIDKERDSDTEEMDDRKTIPYASPKRENDIEIDEKIFKEPKDETAIDIEKQDQIDKEKFIKTELEINKVDIEVSKAVKIKKVQDVFDKVKEEESIKKFY